MEVVKKMKLKNNYRNERNIYMVIQEVGRRREEEGKKKVKR